jgi:hypothetical protein
MMNALHSKNPSWELTIQESLPLLKVISKLGPIIVVKSSPLGQTLGLPHFCFMPSDYNHAALNLEGLGKAMAGFESNGEWFITSDFPRNLCSGPTEGTQICWLTRRGSSI